MIDVDLADANKRRAGHGDRNRHIRLPRLFVLIQNRNVVRNEPALIIGRRPPGLDAGSFLQRNLLLAQLVRFHLAIDRKQTRNRDSAAVQLGDFQLGHLLLRLLNGRGNDSLNGRLLDGLFDHGLLDHGLLDDGLLDDGLLDHGLLDDGLLDHGLLDHGLLDDGLLDHGLLNDGLLNDGLLDHGLLDHGLLDDGLLDDGLLDHGLLDHGLLDHGLLDDGLLDDGLLDHGLLNDGLLNGGFLDHGRQRDKHTLACRRILRHRHGELLAHDGLEAIAAHAVIIDAGNQLVDVPGLRLLLHEVVSRVLCIHGGDRTGFGRFDTEDDLHRRVGIDGGCSGLLSGSGLLSRLLGGSGFLSRLLSGSRLLSRLLGGSGLLSRLLSGSGLLSRLLGGSGLLSRLLSGSGLLSRLLGGSGLLSRLLGGSGLLSGSRLLSGSGLLSRLLGSRLLSSGLFRGRGFHFRCTLLRLGFYQRGGFRRSRFFRAVGRKSGDGAQGQNHQDAEQQRNRPFHFFFSLSTLVDTVVHYKSFIFTTEAVS